jgi:hypothetical protein
MKIVAFIDLLCCLYFVHGQFNFLRVTYFCGREITEVMEIVEHEHAICLNSSVNVTAI